MNDYGPWRHPPRARSGDSLTAFMVTIGLCFALVAGFGAAIISGTIAELKNININHEVFK